MKNFQPFCQNSVHFDVKMFRPGDFDVKIARIWKVFARILILFDAKILKNFHKGTDMLEFKL